ncbi:MAG: hypothetical protein WC845_00815 [Candidatus Staskawiczbacteria bacterium]|jgi:hypothetical protein
MTAEKEEQLKDLLDRSAVRTMRKDIQALREGVALKEKDRIINMKTPEEELAEKAKMEMLKRGEAQKQNIGEEAQARAEILQKKSTEETQAMVQLKSFASEEEKQQIFYLETEKNDLAKKVQAIQREKEPPLLLQKNKLLLERNNAEVKLRTFSEEEKNVEGEQNFLSETEQTTNAPKDKQTLEKKRWESEEKRESMEKRRWAMEKEIEGIEKRMQDTDDEYQRVLAEEDSLKQKIAEISNSLRLIYIRITSREEESRKSKKAQTDLEGEKRAEIESKRKEEIRRQEYKKVEHIEEKPFIKSIPDSGKKEELIKKMQETSTKEEDERRKFLESLDKWAEQDTKKNENPPNVTTK